MSEDNLGLQIETGDLEELTAIFHRDRLSGVAESLHEFTLEVGGRVPMARYDPQRVRQILDALVDNSIKFTPTRFQPDPPGGRVGGRGEEVGSNPAGRQRSWNTA